MLLNNLDPRGGRAPGAARRLRRDGSGGAEPRGAARRSCGRCCGSRDDETLLVQSGKPVGVFRTRPWAPRVLIANSLLVPRWATWDEFRRLEAEGLTMFGQMTAGSWIYIGTQGILQGTYQTFAAAGEKHFGSADLAGRTILTAGLGGMGGAQPLAATMAGAAILCVEVDPIADRAPARDAVPRRGRRLARRRRRARARRRRPRGERSRSGCSATRPSRAPGARRARRALRPRHRPDRGARPADGLRARRGAVRGGGRRCASAIRIRTCAWRVRRSSRTSRGCSSSSGRAATFSTMATTCEGRPMTPA